MTRGEWVLLLYRIPRVPSTPRIAVWRRLKRLGVAQLGDGLVGLPLDARTREQLEWVAEEVREADGEATIWFARPATERDGQAVSTALAQERAAEYRAVIADADAVVTPARRTVQRLRRQLRRINRRDHFPPPERQAAAAAVDALATRLTRAAEPEEVDTP